MEPTGDVSQTERLSVSYVEPEHIDFVWRQLEPMIQRGLKRGAGDSVTSESLRESVKSGDRILLAVHEGTDVTAGVLFEVQQHPAKKILFVIMVAGRDFDSWAQQAKEMMLALKDEYGADSVQATVRDGFVPVLKRYGWKKKATLMEMM